MALLRPEAVSAYLKLHGELRHYAGVRNKDALRRAFPWLLRNGLEVLVACGVSYGESAQILQVDLLHVRDWMRDRDLPPAREQNVVLGVLANKIGELISSLTL